MKKNKSLNRIFDLGSYWCATKQAQTFVCACFVMCRKQARNGCPYRDNLFASKTLSPFDGKTPQARATKKCMDFCPCIFCFTSIAYTKYLDRSIILYKICLQTIFRICLL